MAVLEGAMILNETMMTALMELTAIVRDTSPRTSHRRPLTPLVSPLLIPTPPAIRTLLEEVMVEIVRRKAGTPPLAAAEATVRMAATIKAAIVAEVIVVRVTAESATTKNIAVTRMTRPMVLRN